MTYKMHISMTTPDYDGDDGTFECEYPLEFAEKRDMHKVEKALGHAMMQLIKLTSDELDTGKKSFAKSNPQLVVFETNIEKDGVDYGGYKFRWPNQSDEARAYLKAMMDGLMSGVGHGTARKALARGKRS